MAKRKKKRDQLSIQLGLNDERFPKLIGVLCLFFGLIFFLAFTSYLWTWKEDQNWVLNFEWSFLFSQGVSMANLLGKFGALISHFFFYNGFGLSSFVFIYMLWLLGVSLIRRRSINEYGPILLRSFGLMVFLSILFHFFFQDAEFPFGGAFGSLVTGWLQGLLGKVGTILLFMLAIVGILIWVLNPNLNGVTPRSLAEELGAYLEGKGIGTDRNLTPKPSEIESAPTRSPTQRILPKAATQPAPKPSEEEAEEKASQLTFDLENNPTKKRTETSKKEKELELETNIPTQDTGGPAPGQNPLNPVLAEASKEDHSEPYDPTLELSSYEHPVLPLLRDYAEKKVEIDRAELETNKDQIIETLLNYKIEIIKIRATIGPTVTLYEIVPAPGIRISKIKNLEDDIALSLSALGIRIIAPIPGKGTIGIEVPNRNPQIVGMREVLASDKFKRAKMDLPIALGKTIEDEVFVADLAKMPHLLIAGATGQGKSVGINAIIISLLYKKHPSQIKLVLIDPKKVELFPYSKLEHHFLGYLPNQDEPITTETNTVVYTLNSLCIEMDQRYDLLKKARARNIREYNEKFVQRKLNPLKGHRFLPFIVLIIDEFADLIMTAGKEIELPIGRLAQLARAVGIHLIIATQRPSVNIITGVIKANFPARIAFKVSAKVDSRTILDAGGAEQLIGRGDMLLSVGGDMLRLQCAFVDTPEVERVIQFIAEQPGYPEPYLLPEFFGEDHEIAGAEGLKYSDLDEKFEDAARLIVSNQHGSTSMIQRRLSLGYNRAGRIMDQLEAMGIVGPSEGSKAREVLIYDELELEKYLQEIRARN